MTKNIAAMNEAHLRIVVRAALEDLAEARQEHGAASPAHREQLERSMSFIRGSLEEVLTAALTELDRRAHGGRSRPTETG